MFERFTDRARRVIVLAQEEARLLNHNYIGTEHILLGILNEGDSVAATALHSFEVSLDSARALVRSIIGPGTEVPEGHIPFTPRAKKVLELSLREAVQLGHSPIRPEHILLGLVREGEGVGAQVLVNFGADYLSVREAVVALSGGRALPSVQPFPERVRAAPAPPYALESMGRRCSFCLRSEDRAARIVRGPAGRICDECLARASALMAEAGEESPRRLRLRPPEMPSTDFEGTLVDVERAFETVFGRGAFLDQRLALIEDSDDLRPVVERVVALTRAGGQQDVWVDHVRLISDDEAEVHWSPLITGGARMVMHGFAVLDGGVWKVRRASYLEIASLVGVPFPTGQDPPA